MSILEWNLHDINEMLLLMIPVPSPHRLLSTCNMSCMYEKLFSKQRYLFYLRATLRYKCVRQSSEVNLLGNSPKTIHGPLRRELLDDFPTQFFGQLSDKILLFWTTLRFNSCHALTLIILGCPDACEIQYDNSQQFIISSMHILTKINTQQHVNISSSHYLGK